MALPKCPSVMSALLSEWEKTKMAAMKNLLINIYEQVHLIGVDLNQVSESSDLDQMKAVLRQTIANSVLTIAFIEELEKNK
jgi:hypothetical protein